MDDGIRLLLKDHLGDNVFKGILKPDEKNCTVKDTTIFGRPAYVISQEKTETTFGVETYTKIIEWVDKMNGLPYYKYGSGKAGDKVITDGKIKLTEANVAYDGASANFTGFGPVLNISMAQITLRLLLYTRMVTEKISLIST